MNKKASFYTALAVQLVIIFGMVLHHFLLISFGQTVVLQIQPVDPRDPLRGDYVTFEYDITTIDGARLDVTPSVGMRIYIPLYKSGVVWRADNWDIATEIPSDDARPYVSGVIKSFSDTEYESYNLRVAYGIEEFFIPENAGKGVSFWDKDVKAVVQVGDDGSSSITHLVVDGKQWP